MLCFLWAKFFTLNYFCCPKMFDSKFLGLNIYLKKDQKLKVRKTFIEDKNNPKWIFWIILSPLSIVKFFHHSFLSRMSFFKKLIFVAELWKLWFFRLHFAHDESTTYLNWPSGFMYCLDFGILLGVLSGPKRRHFVLGKGPLASCMMMEKDNFQ